MGQYAKLIDISKCVGCRACEVACKEWNETGSDDPANHPFGYQSHEDLTYKTWNIVKFYELQVGDNTRRARSDRQPILKSAETNQLVNQFELLLGPEPEPITEISSLDNQSVFIDLAADKVTDVAVDELNYSVWNVVNFFEQESSINAAERAALPRWMFRKHGCMHCTEAACIKACPVDALARNDELGYVRLDVKTCTGCGYCVDACPFDVPQLASGAILGFGKVSKCRLCSDRIQHGMQPACVQSCPPNALEFGDREEMLALGRRRIEDLQQRGHQEAYLYGERELGGLNVLTVLPGKPEDFDLPSKPKVPEYLTTWKEVVQPIGALAIAGTALALGFGFLNSILRSRGKGDH